MYREPPDRALRQLLTGPDALQAIAKPSTLLKALREVCADQYGLRTIVQADETATKFEIVLEGRISLEPPNAAGAICEPRCVGGDRQWRRGRISEKSVVMLNFI